MTKKTFTLGELDAAVKPAIQRILVEKLPAPQSLRFARFCSKVEAELKSYTETGRKLFVDHEITLDEDNVPDGGEVDKFNEAIEALREEKVSIDIGDCMVDVSKLSDTILPPAVMMPLEFIFTDED